MKAASAVIALVTCTTKHVRELGPLLVSIAAHAPGARVVLFADAPGRRAVSACAGHFGAALALEVHSVDALGAALPDYNVGAKGQPSKFTCASAKLLLQGSPVLAGSRFVLAMDIDTVALEPLSHLWEWSEVMAARQTLWGLVAESKAAAARPTGDASLYFNTGVLL